MVQVPLIVDRDSGVNDMLDRDGSRTPVEFPCGLGLERPIQAQVVQAATKWKRMALKTFDCDIGEGICTDMKAIRKDYFPGPRPQRLRGPVGLGKVHVGMISVTLDFPHRHGATNLEGDQGCGAIRPGNVSPTERPQVSGPSR